MGVTLDTGALIALESIAHGAAENRTAYKLAALLARPATASREPLIATTPAVVVGEWWRGQRGPMAKLLVPDASAWRR